ncbi:centromere/kinetochore protein zw10 homolog [Haliotis cracherodii]|uniref:centromere/kinetochore protein zw10 homolog n=1 Tax=Haliotis cracherodii TaxID=6455 RepID=UPI0039E9C606
MASFVAEVLSSAAQLEKEEILGKLSTLAKKTDEMKAEIQDLVTRKYKDFDPCYGESSQLGERVEGLSEEMSCVTEKIESEIRGQLNMSTGEFQSLTRELQEMTSVMTVLERLAKFQDLLENRETALREKKYSEAASCLDTVYSLLQQTVHDRQGEMTIMASLRTECEVQKQKFIFDLGDVWKEHIFWTTSDTSEGGQWELKLLTGGAEAEVVQEMVVAMAMLQVLQLKMKSFGEKLLSCFIKPLVLNEEVIIDTKSVSQTHILWVSVASSKKVTDSYVTVLDNIFSMLNYLHIKFLKFPIAPNSSVTLMELLGTEISSQAVDVIVKECLSHAIPTNRKDLEHFQEVVARTELFQKQLLDLGFIKSDNSMLTDYVRNVDVLFANKKCQEILEQARQMMTSEIHNTTVISDDQPLGEVTQLDSGPSSKKTRKVEISSEVPLSGNTFKMPTCHISSSVNCLMNLAYETLHEATESSPQCAIQMFYAVRNIFELYCGVFPTYHRQSLSTLPQLTALHHNNCMFIAHHLMTLGHQFSKKLPSTLNATFVDLIYKIKKIGTESFQEQLNTQKSQISESLKGSNGFSGVSDDEQYFAAERSIKQCLHQLTHLQNVWQEVLPVNMYRKAIGMLVNTMVSELTDYICVLEDISSDDARHLHSLLSVVLEKAGPLFNTPTDKADNMDVELQRNVSKWRKFKELHLVLNASLQKISDRWAEKKGPLALDFSANEIKQLIRALFQNTDRRAAVLSKIR